MKSGFILKSLHWQKFQENFESFLKWFKVFSRMFWKISVKLKRFLEVRSFK